MLRRINDWPANLKLVVLLSFPYETVLICNAILLLLRPTIAICYGKKLGLWPQETPEKDMQAFNHPKKKAMQGNARPCKAMQDHARPCKANMYYSIP